MTVTTPDPIGEALELLYHAINAPGRKGHDDKKCRWCSDCADSVIHAIEKLGGKVPE